MGKKSWIEDIIPKPECPDCGKAQYLMDRFQCNGEDIVHNRTEKCKRKVCDKCVYRWEEKRFEGGISKTYYYCKNHIKKSLYELNETQLDELKYHGSVRISEKKVEGFLKGKDIEDMIDSIIFDKGIMRQQMIEHEEKEKMESINNLIMAEKFEEALILVEEIGLWKEAGKIRKKIRDRDRKDREIVTKHIHLNANDLFKQIRHEGLVVPYKCPNCNGTLKITGNKKIDECPYCGSDLDLKTLNNFVTMLME